MIKLVNDTIGNNDIDILVDWLKTYPQLTKGPVTLEFEKAWSKYLGVNYSVFVNSGSSAILLSLLALKEKYGLSTIVVPALSWATDLSSPLILGMGVELCDCNLEDLSVDLNHLEHIFETENPEALLLVPVLGLVPNMKDVLSLCNQYNVILIEDCCEAMGSEYNGKKLGTFGSLSTFSLFFGHHISSIEGGLVSTNNKDLYDILKSLRSHGWARDWEKEKQAEAYDTYDINTFYEPYSFFYSGLNLRSTDLQAKIGLRQLEKLPKICQIREKNFNAYEESVNNGLSLRNRDEDFISNFAFPILSNKRDVITDKFYSNGIDCRPLIAGSLAKQPAWEDMFKKAWLPNATKVYKEGLYVPNHPEITQKDIDQIARIVNNTPTS